MHKTVYCGTAFIVHWCEDYTGGMGTWTELNALCYSQQFKMSTVYGINTAVIINM